MNVKKVVVLAILVALFLFLVIPRGSDPSEIEHVVGKVVAAGEAKDLDRFMSSFSHDYRDESGLTYVTLKGFVRRMFERYDSFHGEVSRVAASFGKDDQGRRVAAATMDVYVEGVKAGIPVALIGTSDSPKRIKVTLRRGVLGGWKIVSVGGIGTKDY